MIPEFPNLKRLEMSDRGDVEKFTSKYPPYSDYNFVSIWSWDINGEMRISELNGNLVVRFVDYITSEAFYSYLGNNKVNETAEALLKFSQKEGLKSVLKLVPEDSIKGLNEDRFEIIEDKDNFDYIFSTEELSSYDGSKFAKKRNLASQFLKKYPNIELIKIDISDKKIQKQIIELDDIWLNNKLSKKKEHYAENETLALQRIFSLSPNNLSNVGLYRENKLVAFSISELLPNKYSISHFSKSNTDLTGISEYLMQENAKLLLGNKRYFFNYEQDLGLENLRFSKNSFRPTLFLKKYSLRYKSNN